jgi:putative hemolysin
MKKYVFLAMMAALLAACEKKETNVTNPAEKKETNTTIVNPSPAKSP